MSKHSPAKRGRGRPSRYTGKIRERPISFTLTPGGWAALGRLLAARDRSRADLLEELIRDAAARI